MHDRSFTRRNSPPRRRGSRLAWLGVALVLAGSGCQAIVPSALGGKLALSEDARIAKQAKADSFPSPSDVGLVPVDSEL
jgi:hypothetical protein